MKQFQSTLPRGERLDFKQRDGCSADFNPRSHEGSDMIYDYGRANKWISIHAPTRGATGRSWNVKNMVTGFQSTLPRGERPVHAAESTASNKFQSTLPRGERHDMVQDAGSVTEISIHAPTRGATTQHQ